MCGFLGCGWMDMELDKCHLGFAVSMLRKDKKCVENFGKSIPSSNGTISDLSALARKKFARASCCKEW